MSKSRATKTPDGTVRYVYTHRTFSSEKAAERAAVQDGVPNTHEEMARVIHKVTVIDGQWVRS